MSDVVTGWEEKVFKECVTENRKSTLKVSDASNFGDYNFYTSGESVLKHYQALIDGANIYLATGGTANVKFENGPAAYSTDTYSLKSKEDVDPKYLYYFLLSNLQYINDNFFQGSGLKHLQKKGLKKFLVNLPEDINEQKKIVKILSKVDKAIENTEALIQKYECIKVGLMQDLLTKGIDKNGNIRSEETHLFKDSPLGRIPVEWEICSLKDISKVKDYIKTGPFGSSLKTEHWREVGIPVVTIGSLGMDSFIKDNLLYIEPNKAKEMSSYRLERGDLLFSRVADVGRVLVISDQEIGWIMSSNFMRLRINQDIFNPYLLESVIKHSISFKRQIQELVNESGRSVTNSKILNSFLFIRPSLIEQNIIIDKLNVIKNFINQKNQEREKLNLKKQGLMQDLLSGKVRVNN